MPEAIATSGGTRKPFSYCPGGIDFSELKSPKMAKRIAKHQRGMTPSAPSAPSPTMGVTSQSPSQPIPQYNTLPNHSTGSSQPKPQFGRQRSISDLLSTPTSSPCPSTLPQVSSSPIFAYNPYASDRSISIPPPTPPPILPKQSVEPMNRANSLPPSAAPAAPVRNTTLNQPPKQSQSRPGLPPPHPLHQLSLSQQNEKNVNPKTSQCTPQSTIMQQEAIESNQFHLQGPSQNVTRQKPTPPTNPHSNMTQVNSNTTSSLQSAPTKFVPPPPPPPPPPGSMGIVAKCGVSGVPLPGKKQVRATIALADIRAGNSYLEPDPQPVAETLIQSPACQNTIAEEYLQEQQSDLTNNSYDNGLVVGSNRDAKVENGFVESLHEFEAQRNAMMSPPATQRNINSFQDPRPNLSINPLHAKETALNQGEQTHGTLPQEFDPRSIDIPDTTQLPLSVIELNKQTLSSNDAVTLGNNLSINKSNQSDSYNYPPSKTLENNNMDFSNATQVSEQTKDIYSSLQHKDQQELIKNSTPNTNTKQESDNKPQKYEHSDQSKPNDDIKMFRPRERSIPRQQSLQRDFEGHNVIPNVYKENAHEQSPAKFLPFQKSIEKDDQELMDINGKIERRGSDANAYVRYRPETPRVVTPVRFSTTPKLPNKGFSRQQSAAEKPQNMPLPPKAIEKIQPTPDIEDMKKICRNVSDSGISVNSSTPEPDESAGKIVTESMQKIEAQMKRILSSENQQIDSKVKDKIEPSESTSSVNSLNIVANTGQDLLPSTMSGYSTCSEEELKFEEPSLDIPLKTAPFEVMEDFEEAPEEFDLGISSYSISHPVESEEMEKTPVPEVLDNGEGANQVFEETPYRVSPPSRNGTLESMKNHTKSEPKSQYLDKDDHIQNNQLHSNKQNNHQQFSSQPKSMNQMNSAFAAAQQNMFNQMSMPSMGMPGMNLPSMPNIMGMPPLHPMFDDTFNQFQNMLDPSYQNTAMFNQTPSMSATVQEKKPSGERIIPIQVLNTSADNLINKTPVNMTSQRTMDESSPFKRTIDVPIVIESPINLNDDLQKSNRYSSQHKQTPPLSNVQKTEAPSSNQNLFYQTAPRGSTSLEKQSPPSYPSTPRDLTPTNKPAPTNIHNYNMQIPTTASRKPVSEISNNFNTPSQSSPLRTNVSSTSTLPMNSNNTRTNETVRYGTASPSISRNSQMSPVPTASMLQNQLSQIQNRKTEERQMPVRNQSVEKQRPGFERSTSVAADNIRSRLVQKTRTPTFNDLQFKYGNKQTRSPSPVLDKDYQKEARQTVVGELSRYAGVQQASKIAGTRKKPSQSPSMRLLGMLHVHDDPNEPEVEYNVSSKEYTGDQGRFMPPRMGGYQMSDAAGNYQRSLSSQL